MLEAIAELLTLTEEFNYYVLGLELAGYTEGGRKRYKPREGLTIEECDRRMKEYPQTGSLNEMREMIREAKSRE